MAPNFNKQFRIETDASDVAVGCVLSQKHNGVWKVCGYLSRLMSCAERKYPIFECEALAIRTALLHWRHYLQGHKEDTIVLTDHKNVLSLKSAKTTSPRLMRWAMFFDTFRLRLEFIKGDRNGRADALSRYYSKDETEEMELEKTKPLFNFCEITKDSERIQCMREAHESKIGGHTGLQATLKRLDQMGKNWRGRKLQVAKYLKQCVLCAECKPSRQKPMGLLQPHSSPSHPFQIINVDFVTGLVEIDGYSCIMTVVDRFSKFTHLIPLQGLPTTLSTAEALFNFVFKLHGIPEVIILDQGSQFVSGIARWLSQELGIVQNIGSPYHPETDGQVERSNQIAETYLRTYVNAAGSNWVRLLSFAEFSINSRYQSTIKMTPAEAAFGRKLRTCSSGNKAPPYKSLQELREVILKVHKQVQQNLDKGAERMKINADRHRRIGNIVKGDLVMLSTKK